MFKFLDKLLKPKPKPLASQPITKTPPEPPKTAAEPSEPPPLPTPSPEPEVLSEVKLTLSSTGLDFLIGSEGFRAKPYPDSRGIWTIGYGNTFYEDGRPVQATDPTISKQRATELKLFVLEKFQAEIRKLVKVPLNQNQYDAIVNLVYNIGVEAFKNSALLKKLNEGKYLEAADQFLVWKKSGKDPNILLPRRERERNLFLKKVN